MRNLKNWMLAAILIAAQRYLLHVLPKETNLRNLKMR
jgi:hypothetical protein